MKSTPKSASSRTQSQSLIRSGILPAEYHKRRERVLNALDGAAGVVYAGDGGGFGHGKFKADSHFVYLTGITTEQGAAVLFNPAAEDPDRRIGLFLRPLNPETERWERYRDMIGEELRARAGFKHVMRTDYLPMQLLYAARRCGKCACLHSVGSINAPVPADLSAWRKATERLCGVSVVDRTMLLSEMRAVKSAAELTLMRHAAAATKAGFIQAMRTVRPGVREMTVQRTLEETYLSAGAEEGVSGHAFPPIVGSGLNATLLHYEDNAAVCRAGELLLIDSGAKVDGYCADVTRTIPVSGTFTAEQRELYEVVLKAQSAAIKAAKPGAYLWQVDHAARGVIRAAGLSDAFMHGTGHHLGMDVHDCTPDGKLKPGMVITVEPGVYFADRAGGIGIRIEDDVLITARGNEILTSGIPKTVAEVEHAMRTKG